MEGIWTVCVWLLMSEMREYLYWHADGTEEFTCWGSVRLVWNFWCHWNICVMWVLFYDKSDRLSCRGH